MPRATPEKPADKLGDKLPDKAVVAKPRKPRARKASDSDSEVRLTGDRLVVRVPENGERKSLGGLLIPATAMPAPKHLAWAEVHLVGPDVRVAKLGDRVLFLPSSGLEVELDGEDLVLLRERDVQAVASPPATKADRQPGQYL
ncbi:MAG: co-chaperone GroES [Actinomycetota bacterium]